MSTFMENMFQHLPADLQVKIMIHHAQSLPPRPKFKPGEKVRYKPATIKTMKQALGFEDGTYKCTGPMPFGDLYIYGVPMQCGKRNWKYDYEYGYGLTSEGSAYESDLIAYNKLI